MKEKVKKIIQLFSWVNESNHKIISSNDFDGIFSAIFLHQIKGCEVIGFYDLETIWYDEKITPADLKDAIWIDLDIYHKSIRSIGHHILKFRLDDKISGHSQTLNPNFLRDIYHGNFERKYPFGTIHFLLWLYNYSFNQPPSSLKFLLWHPNSSLTNAQKYYPNVKEWLENFLQNKIMLETLDKCQTEEFEIGMRDNIHNKIQSTGFERGRGQTKTRHLGLGGYQCSFNDPEKALTQLNRLIKMICEITSWGTIQIPQRYHQIKGTRNRITYQDLKRSHGSLDNFLTNEKVFSYVIPNKGQINYTNNITI